jgi:hypothetical protein
MLNMPKPVSRISSISIASGTMRRSSATGTRKFTVNRLLVKEVTRIG